MNEFMVAARAEPGKITYGSSGIGNTTHVVGELSAAAPKVELIHVPYKATPINDAMAGTINSLLRLAIVDDAAPSGRASCARWAFRAPSA